MPGSSVITAINSAIEGLSRSLAIELAPIRVNSVSPGITDTPIYSGMPSEQREAMFKQVGASLPVKRIGRPEEIAQAVLFLMSNGYATGGTLFIDGGSLIK